MLILAVDTGQVSLEKLVRCIRKLHPEGEVMSFRDPMLAVKYGILNPPDALYTAIDMRRMNGREAARMLEKENPRLLVHFVADGDTQRSEAISLGARYCTVRPVTEEKLRAEENRSG